MNIKKSVLTVAVLNALTLSTGVGTANATLVTNIFSLNGPWVTDRGNLTMLTPDGGRQGGTNDVVMTWDGNAYNSITDYTGLTSASNVTAASNQTFAGFLWSAHNIQMFTAGSYTFDTALEGGTESGDLALNVNTGQLGMHMLVDWGTATANSCGVANCNIDIAVLMNANGPMVFGSGLGVFENPSICTNSSSNTNCLWNGGPASSFAGGIPANRPAASHAWMLTSIDGNGDGIPGIPMAPGGPLNSFNANFNFDNQPIPLPSALWLFGSGLAGLFGFIRRRKN